MSLRSSVQQFPTEEAVPFGFLGQWPAVATGPAARQENKDSDASGARGFVSCPPNPYTSANAPRSGAFHSHSAPQPTGAITMTG